MTSRLASIFCIACGVASTVVAATPNPVLTTVFPAGVRAGENIEITVTSGGLGGSVSLRSTVPGFLSKHLGDGKYRISIPAHTPPGLYDLRISSSNGLTNPRILQVGNRDESVEAEPNETLDAAKPIPLGSTVNGRIAQAADQDCFRFTAHRGQRVILECWSHRIDSQLRPVLQLFDSRGRLLQVNRGFYGIDPLIDFHVPADGDYTVRLYDLTYSGGADHVYRLDLDTGPRVAFAVPSVIQADHPGRVQLFGWNLDKSKPAHSHKLQSVTVEIPGDQARPHRLLPLRMHPSQMVVEGLAWQLPGSHAPVFIGVTDIPVVTSATDNHTSQTAQAISFPCEISGQLVRGDEQDWYAIQARRGEVLYFEGLGQRIWSPVDLGISILDATGKRVLFRCQDELGNPGGLTLPTRHSDPAGRWVAPSDGRFLVVVHNQSGGIHDDPRRIYRLSIRREEPRVDVTAISPGSSPSGLNVTQGGRAVLDIVALRRRGLTGSIRVSARRLPSGLECPDIWLGPGVNRGQLVITAGQAATPFSGSLALEATANGLAPYRVHGGTVVRGGRPSGWSRLTGKIPLAVAGTSPLQVTADGHETRVHHLYGELKVRHAPGGVLDVAVTVNRRDANHRAPVQLIGVGVPHQIANQTATIPAEKDKGYISFYLPPGLSPGRYTLGLRAQTTVPTADGKKSEGITVFTNPVVFEVHEPVFQVALDPYNPKTIQRGKIVQIKYTVRRINGFINKVHTELAAPGHVTKVRGMRGRGVTFVGQTESGTIQIAANDDAPLGQQPFLRIYAVGVLEDEARFHGSCFLQLKITE